MAQNMVDMIFLGVLEAGLALLVFPTNGCLKHAPKVLVVHLDPVLAGPRAGQFALPASEPLTTDGAGLDRSAGLPAAAMAFSAAAMLFGGRKPSQAGRACLSVREGPPPPPGTAPAYPRFLEVRPERRPDEHVGLIAFRAGDLGRGRLRLDVFHDHEILPQKCVHVQQEHR
jgi:hypothetical protein